MLRRGTELEEWIDRISRDMVHAELPEARRKAVKVESDTARAEMGRQRGEIMKLVEQLQARFHPT